MLVLVYPLYSIKQNSIHMVAALAILVQAIIFALKLISYAHVMRSTYFLMKRLKINPENPEFNENIVDADVSLK